MVDMAFPCFKTEVSLSPLKFMLTRLFVCTCHFTPSWSVKNVKSAVPSPKKLDTCMIYAQMVVFLCLTTFS